MMIEMKKIKLFIGIAAWLAVSTCCSTDPFADWGTETESGQPVLPDGTDTSDGGSGSFDGTGTLFDFEVVIDDTDMSGDDIDETIVADKNNENYDDFIENSEFSSTVEIAYSGTSATVISNVEGVDISQDGAHVVVTSTVKKVEYILSGVTTDGSFKVYSDNKFKLTLNGVNIVNPSGAAINIQSGKRVFVVSPDGTENTLVDGSSYVLTDGEDMKGCFFSEGQLIFSGGGKLRVTGNYKHGICSDDYVRFRQGSRVTVVGAVKDGIHVNDAVVIGGGILNITATDDGIQCEKGPISVTGGRTTVITTGNAVYEDSDISSSSCINGGTTFAMTAGTVLLKSSGSAGKGLNCDGEIYLYGGTLRVVTTGKQYVYGRLDSSAKGIKSKSSLTIESGAIWVRATGGEGSEGIESKNVMTINGGDIAVYAYDDCLNASNNITINGGSVYCYSTGNDGVDSNGTLTITGGTVVASGTASPEDGFDCDQNTFKITGGTVLGIGGGTSTPTANSCTQRSVIYGGSGSAGQYIGIQSSDGTNLMTYMIPRTYQQMTLLFSSPQLENGSYTIYTGGSVTDGSSFYGLYTGAIYDGGTQAATFTANSMVTQIGSASGGGNPGGGGGPGGGPGGWGW
ncbi:hypothetical protein HMPREF1071_03384 [Bacteroides salyersiae CL02T12C01]|uniref:Carbohydrate-binding domain-containing protein n=2 Tax=Bacteroides salyersiae TaxID=291644 RepID=I9HI03_9BACE|nr:hypothetical protein HMPREF1071_03384 [Bacteroides salyersiae CL02T12C01]